MELVETGGYGRARARIVELEGVLRMLALATPPACQARDPARNRPSHACARATQSLDVLARRHWAATADT